MSIKSISAETAKKIIAFVEKLDGMIYDEDPYAYRNAEDEDPDVQENLIRAIADGDYEFMSSVVDHITESAKYYGGEEDYEMQAKWMNLVPEMFKLVGEASAESHTTRTSVEFHDVYLTVNARVRMSDGEYEIYNAGMRGSLIEDIGSGRFICERITDGQMIIYDEED